MKFLATSPLIATCLFALLSMPFSAAAQTDAPSEPETVLSVLEGPMSREVLNEVRLALADQAVHLDFISTPEVLLGADLVAMQSTGLAFQCVFPNFYFCCTPRSHHGRQNAKAKPGCRAAEHRHHCCANCASHVKRRTVVADHEVRLCHQRCGSQQIQVSRTYKGARLSARLGNAAEQRLVPLAPQQNDGLTTVVLRPAVRQTAA